MAYDQVRVMRELGFEDFAVAGTTGAPASPTA